jgi:hypothetical protein
MAGCLRVPRRSQLQALGHCRHQVCRHAGQHATWRPACRTRQPGLSVQKCENVRKRQAKVQG